MTKRFLTTKLPILVSALVIISLGACTSANMYLKSSYNKAPYTNSVALDKESAWNRVITALDSCGISIFKIASKKDGILVSETIDFSDSFTYETKDGRLENPAAYVVIADFKEIRGRRVTPQNIKGTLTVRFKEEGGKMSVSVFMTELKCIYEAGSHTTEDSRYSQIESASTGVLENTILKAISK